MKLFYSISVIILVFAFVGCTPATEFDVSQHGNQMPDEVKAENRGCLECHGLMTGMSKTHAAAGCVACHLGDGKQYRQEEAHAEMAAVPGNFSDMEITCGKCHADAVKRISTSIMATNSGLVSVDKYVFGEIDFPEGHFQISGIKQSVADNHLRNLCASCHLGREKAHPAPVTEKSRGGGCVACHVNYTTNVQADILSKSPRHPTIDLNVSANHCFGCHSRSGRISTNYEGWHETPYRKGDTLPANITFRLLQDGRYFEKQQPDVHHTVGLQCVDCHVYSGVMGDGNLYEHAEDAVKIACDDCHSDTYDNRKTVAQLSPAEKRIYTSRKYDQTEFLYTKTDSSALLNSYFNEEGRPMLKSKFFEKEFALSSPGESCLRTDAHQNISCSACHSAWAPQCVSCHVQFDPDKKGFDLLDKKRITGSWREDAERLYADLPPLGVFRYDDSIRITAAVPGMILTLDNRKYDGHRPHDTAFLRLYAPAKPHTIARTGRDCKSCHNSSLALGYGRGELTFVTDSQKPQWQFVPDMEQLTDGLPADAWVPFLGARSGKVSTRTNFTPFTMAEQQKILRVGACLTCHDDNSAVMHSAMKFGMQWVLPEKKEECREPVY